MKILSLKISVFLLILLTASASRAEITVKLRLDRSETLLTDSVQMIVSVAGSRDSDSPPEVQGLENFEVRSGGTSSRVEFINGKVSSSVDYTYFILPRKAGNFRIGPAQVVIDDKTYSSNAVTLRVGQPAKEEKGDRGPIFLAATLADDTVYVEEQTIYTLKLYLRRNVRNIKLQLPEAENLIFKQISKPAEYRSTHGGREYQVLEVKYVLVPSRAGSYAIEPSKMSMTVLQVRRRSGRSIIDDPFSSFSSGRPASVSSESLQLTVRPLPEKGKPPDFSGLVGKYKMWSKLDPVSLKTGESATLTVSVSGEGNVNRIPDLEIPELDQIKIYADKPVLESTQDNEGLKGSKIMKWALVPEKDGRLEVPPVTISFFDTEDHTYKTLKSSSYTLSVLPGKKESIALLDKNSPATTEDSTVKQTIRELGRDIFPVHTSMQDFKTVKQLKLESWIFWAMMALPFFLYIGTLCGMKLRRQSRASLPDTVAKRAAREFARKYRKHETSNSKLHRLIREYLNHRFGLSYGSLTPQEAVQIVTSRGAGTETAEAMGRIIQQLENAEFTGRGQEAAVIDGDLMQLIKQIEKESR